MKLWTGILIASVIILLQGCAMITSNQFDATMQSIAGLQEQGRLSESDAEANRQLMSKSLSDEERIALENEIERSRRIRMDYTLTEDELYKAVSDPERGIPNLPREEFNEWVALGWFDGKAIDGEMRYVGASRSNLFFRQAQLRERKATPGSDTFERFLLAHIREVKNAWRADAQVTVKPHRFRNAMTITVKGGKVAEGETIRCWMPYPQQYAAQSSVMFLGASPEPKWINNPAYPQRSLYFEQASRGAEPTAFSADYEVTTWPRHTPVDPAIVVADPAAWSDPSAAAFAKEQAPHVDFTPRILALERQIAGGETNPAVKARLYYDWICKNIKYSYAREYSTLRNISMYVCENGYGDCGQIALLYIALCRAGGVPARWQSGWVMYPMLTNLHDWTEIYLEPYGWIPVDPDFGAEAESVFTGLTREERDEMQDFFFGGLDAYRLVVNRDHGFPHYPAKQSMRSDTVDFQRGELETSSGKNIYFDEFNYRLKVEELAPCEGSGSAYAKAAPESAEKKELLQPGLVR